MKITRKFTFVLILGMCVVLTIEATLTLRRENELIEADMQRDHLQMGHALAAAIHKVWQHSGEAEALQLIQEANASNHLVEVRLVRLEAPPGDASAPRLAAEELAPLRSMRAADFFDRSRDGVGYLYTYIPLPVDASKPAALELTESLTDEKNHVRAIIQRILLTTLAVAGVSGLIATVLGYWLVGRPTRQLIDRAQGVGAGDLVTRLHFRRKDEFADLAGEINLMCDHLNAANRKAAAETSARIQSIEQLRRADRLATVGKLASGIAHELGTPLNVVMARAKMIATAKSSDAEGASNARLIVEQTDHMTRIIRQLLDFARPRSPKKAGIDLWLIIRQIILLLKPIASKQGVAIETDGDASQRIIDVDAGQMQQVFSNLMVNGIQAMPRGGRISVSIEARRQTPPGPMGGPELDAVGIHIRDAGMGISEENQRHLFEPFFTTKGVGEGTGLGLSVSRGIVQEHGGWIEVESKPGTGSCFTVWLRGGGPA